MTAPYPADVTSNHVVPPPPEASEPKSHVIPPAGEPAGIELDELATRPVVPRRRPGRWLAVGVVLVLVAQFVHGLVTNPFYQWHTFATEYFFRPVIIEGLITTLQVTALSGVIGLVGGVVLALGRLAKNPLLRTVTWFYIWAFRSLPLILVLIFLYNFRAVYPRLGLGVPFGPQWVTFDVATLLQPFWLAVLGLGLVEAAYAAEIVRAGILSVDQGQVEASHALGLSGPWLFRRIILPQALRAIVPTYVNQLIGLIKGASLIFYVSELDIFGEVQTLGARYPGDIIPLLLVAAVWYLILTSVLSVIQFYVERYYSRGAVRTLPPTPLQQIRAGFDGILGRFGTRGVQV
jgi:polar amino acid transport system permease protein